MHTILILLPVAAYSMLTLIFVQSLGVREISEALIKAHLVIFTFIAVSTEFLSSIQAISFPGLLTAWLLFLLVCFAIVILLISQKSQGISLPVFRSPTPLAVIFVGAIVFILTTTLLTAILYPPNNWDSMTYHMSRVVHWMSNGNISFYPTAITRQNYQMPLAEFAIMHIQMLTGFDLYTNLVQWVNFLVLICLGLLVADELGLSSRQQLISAIVVATLPMAILQASSTQNDLVASSFVMSFGLFMLRIRKNLRVENLTLAAIALGLALLTKGTAYLYCAAIGTSLAVSVLLEYRSDRARFLKAIAALFFIAIGALALNAGHLSRNYKLYGHPLSTEGNYYHNADISAAGLFANIARNGALHLGTPFDRVNWYLKRAMKVALGSQLNNPKTTWIGTSFDIPYTRHEDFAGNLIHMLITLLSMISLPILWYRGHHTKAIWYAFGTMLSAMGYCWMLRWQPWASRLHTPFFTMAAPLLAITITAEIGRIGKHTSHLIVLGMVFYSLIFVLDNKSRSLVSLDWYHKDRIELYFMNRAYIFQAYENAINIIQESGSQKIGLYLGSDDWEYPFWVLALRLKKDGREMSFKHVGVSNLSKTIEQNVVLPLYVIATTKLDTWKHEAKYVSVYTSNYVSVFRKSEHNNAISRGNSAILNSWR